jgi:ribosomal-protein-serine acetyltransferase
MTVATRTLVVDDELRLVPRNPSDAPEMFAVVDRNRAALHEWISWIDATRTVQDARRYAHFAESQFEQQVGFDYALRRHGTIAGAIGLYDVDWVSRNGQIGYWLAPEARGQGLMTRACEALTRYAFTGLALHRLEIRCVVENHKSRAIPERLGYRLEGILHQAYLLHQRFRDMALYAALSPTWKAREVPH